MAEKPIFDKYEMVRKSNELIQKSRFELNTAQQKAILFLVSQIKRGDTEFKEYEIPIKTFYDMFSTVGGNSYELLKENLKKLSDKSMWIKQQDGTETLVRWIEKVKINKHNGIVTMRLDEDLKPYLLELQSRYTEYEYFFVLQLKSKYSIRAYELFKSIHFDKLKQYQKTFTIDEIKERLNAPYKEFKELRRNVLSVIYDEINAKTDLRIAFEQIKEKQKTVAIRVILESKDIAERIKLYKGGFKL